MANVMSYANMAKQYRTTYDNSIEDTFLVHTDNGIIQFKKNNEGLYIYKLPEGYKAAVKKHNNKRKECSHMTTLAENQGNHSTAEYGRAKKARKLYHIIGAPSETNYKGILK